VALIIVGAWLILIIAGMASLHGVSRLAFQKRGIHEI
jgi:hypothetical protein